VKHLSDQTRAIIAAGLSLIIIVLWSMVYKPPKPEPRPETAATQTTTGQNSAGQSSATQSAPPGAATPAPNEAVAKAAPPRSKTTKTPPVQAKSEETIVVENGLYRVEISNRGAIVRSWQLKKYKDDHKPPRTLDVVNSDLAQQTGGWPFSLKLSDAQLENAANQGLYQVSSSVDPASEDGVTTLTAPAEVDFHWSDGQLDVTKKLKFDHSYIVELQTTVLQDGQPLPSQIAWRGGFGDVTAFRAAVQTTVFDDKAKSISVLATKNLGAPAQRNTFAEVPGTFDSAGIEDLYFAAAFLPLEVPATGQTAPAVLTVQTRQLSHEIQQEGKTQQEILPEVAVGTVGPPGPLAFRVFVGPKDIDTLKAIRPPLNGLVQLGWTGFIAEPLFYILRWLHRYIPNYGWAIVVMTILINMLLYPLKVSSWRSMQKMQKAAPEVRSIQDRYKKYSMRDPRKQEMNKEVMAVYSREGINPMGSCLPTVAQLPIWWGLYRMLTVTIELRHAPWFGWIHDLSAADPYYILPILMAVLMYVVQKMTPMTVTDPSQQKMMTLMPVLFGGMFIVFPISSGLVLYILTSNVVAIVQQVHLNRTSPLKALVVKGKRKTVKS